MLKTISFCGLLLIMASVLAHADVYRCKGYDGSIIFTDNKSNIPPECQVDIVRDLSYSGEDPSSPFTAVKQRPATQRPVTTTELGQREEVENVYSSLKEQAENLADQFASIRRNVFRSTKVKNKQTARRELAEIRLQKRSLLSEVDQPIINRAQKKYVREILASITE